MYVCVCVCVRMYTHICMRVCVRACVYVRARARVCVCVRLCGCIYLSASLSFCVSVLAHVCVYLCVCVCARDCLSACVYPPPPYLTQHTHSRIEVRKNPSEFHSSQLKPHRNVGLYTIVSLPIVYGVRHNQGGSGGGPILHKSRAIVLE